MAKLIRKKLVDAGVAGALLVVATRPCCPTARRGKSYTARLQAESGRRRRVARAKPSASLPLGLHPRRSVSSGVAGLPPGRFVFVHSAGQGRGRPVHRLAKFCFASPRAAGSVLFPTVTFAVGFGIWLPLSWARRRFTVGADARDRAASHAAPLVCVGGEWRFVLLLVASTVATMSSPSRLTRTKPIRDTEGPARVGGCRLRPRPLGDSKYAQASSLLLRREHPQQPRPRAFYLGIVKPDAAGGDLLLTRSWRSVCDRDLTAARLVPASFMRFAVFQAPFLHLVAVVSSCA